MNNLMTFRNNLYLDDIILKFSIDSTPIPYIIMSNKIQLIDGKKLNFERSELLNNELIIKL